MGEWLGKYLSISGERTDGLLPFPGAFKVKQNKKSYPRFELRLSILFSINCYARYASFFSKYIHSKMLDTIRSSKKYKFVLIFWSKKTYKTDFEVSDFVGFMI